MAEGLSAQQSATTTAPGFVARLHGVVLTHASIGELGECMRRGQYDVKKVIVDDPNLGPEWGPRGGWGPPGGWTDDLRHRVLNDLSPWLASPGHTIVRTVAGDGEHKPYYDRGGDCTEAQDDPKLYPTPDRVVASIHPWYRLWDRSHNFYVEIGNEPNHADWAYCYERGTDLQKQRAHNFIYKWKWYFAQALRAVRQRFPDAKVISPGLSPAKYDVWYQICQPEFSQANCVGFHILDGTDYFGNWSQLLFPVLERYYGATTAPPWFGTEVGLNYLGTGPTNNTKPLNNAALDPTTNQPPQCWGNLPNWFTRKGVAYSEAIHFNRSQPPWPRKVIGATYFHLHTQHPAPRDSLPQYRIYQSDGDYAYRHRVNVGNRFTLRPMSSSQYVCAEGRNPADRRWALIANRNEAQSWETFERVLHQDWVGLKNSRELTGGDPGPYVSADRNLGGLLIANRAVIDVWEMFQLLPSMEDRTRVAIKARSNDMFVQASPATGWELRANYRDPTLRPPPPYPDPDPAWGDPNYPIWFRVTSVP